MPPTIKGFRRSKAAMTLVEVIVSLTLLGLISGSVISITFLIRSTAEQAIYQNTALTVAQGYMEQIRHLDYATLRAVAQDSGGTPTVTLPLENATGGTIAAVGGGTFGNGSWSMEDIYLDQDTSGRPIQRVPFEFRPVLTSLETATSGLASGVEVVVTYRIRYNFGVTRTISGSLRSVRSSVPSY